MNKLSKEQIEDINNYVLELGNIISNAYYTFDYEVYGKDKNDVVTSIDKRIEDRLKNYILSHYPEHAIVAEESENKEGNEYVWYVDPLDGTKNFVNHIPFFSISIALVHKPTNSFIYSSVYNPISKELFFYDSTRAYILINNSLKELPIYNNSRYISIGNPNVSFKHICNNPYFSKLNYRLRQLGSASLELAYVSAGYLNGSLFLNLHKWDYMAGLGLLIGAGIRYKVQQNALVCGRDSFDGLNLVLQGLNNEDRD